MPGTCDDIRGPWCREAQEAWRTCLGRHSGDGGSGVRGRVWKTTLDREGGPEEREFGCSGSLKAEGLRWSRSASPPGPSPSQTSGPPDRHRSPGKRRGGGKGGCTSPWGLGRAVFCLSV